MAEAKLPIMCVKTNKGCFISDCFTTSGYNYDYHRTKIKDLLFDGKKPTDTYCTNWYYIEQYPTSIQRERVGDVINERYELEDESLISDKMPKIILKEDIDKYNTDVIDNLYSYEYDRNPPYLEDVPCDIQVVCEIDNYNFPPKISYEAIHKESFSDRQYTIKNTDVQHQMLDKIIFPAVLLHEKPCKFTSKQMYDITRQYILEHIDNSVAKITSNYAFCFTVKKLIPLIEPETIKYQNIFARTKRERNKIHTTIKKYEEKEIFEMTHDQERYNNYSVIPEMCANSEAELKEKVDAWLEGLMEIINEPLCQCPQCNGTGYVGEIKTEGFSYKENES
jgi:hypothetical protein